MNDNSWDAIAFISCLWIFIAGPYLFPAASRYVAGGIGIAGTIWLIWEGRRLWKEYRNDRRTKV